MRNHPALRLHQPTRILLFGTILSCAGPVVAQQATGGWLEQPTMTGDWGGTRTRLQNDGFDFQFGYTSEAAANVKGGYNDDRTARYSDQFTFGLHLDLARLFEWHDADFQVNVTERNGRDLTKDRLDDPRSGSLGSSVQEIYGRGQTWRFSDLWYRQRYFDQHLQLKVGLIPNGEDFDSTGCTFQNLALCGGLAGHGAGIWYNWPVVQWGSILKYTFTSGLYGQLGVFQYNPAYAADDARLKVDFGGRAGTMYMYEVGWNGNAGQQQLAGVYKLGGYYNTAQFHDVLHDINGGLYPLTGEPAQLRDGQYGVYAYARQQLTHRGSDPARGLSAFVHASYNDKHTATVDYQLQLGLIYTGLFDARPNDDFAIGASKLHVNPDVAERERLYNEIHDVSDYNDPAFIPVQDAESVLEVHYGFVIANWLTVRPNIQLLKHPGGVSEIDTAWVVGVQTMLHF